MGLPDGASVGEDVGTDECVTVGSADGATVGSADGALVVGIVDGTPVGVEEGFAVSKAASAIVPPPVVGKLAMEPTNSPIVGCSVSSALLGNAAIISAAGASTGTSNRGSRNSNPSFVSVTQPPQKSAIPLRIVQSSGGTAPMWTAV